jgi:hypothetical protein
MSGNNENTGPMRGPKQDGLSKPAVIIMFILTSIAVVASVAGNFYGSNDAQVEANRSNVEINFNTLEILEEQVADLNEIVDLQDGMIDLLEGEIATLTQDLINTANRLDGEDDRLESKINEKTLPQGESSGPADFDLELNKNNIRVAESFTLTGYDRANTPLVATMIGSSSSDVFPITDSTKSNGSFSVDFFIPSNWNPGVYSITVVIGEDFDKIVFQVDPK